MPENLQLTLDYTFKKTFTEKHEILIDLINSVLEFPSTSKIECIEIRNPEILPEDIHKRKHNRLFGNAPLCSPSNQKGREWQEKANAYKQNQKFGLKTQRVMSYLALAVSEF